MKTKNNPPKTQPTSPHQTPEETSQTSLLKQRSSHSRDMSDIACFFGEEPPQNTTNEVLQSSKRASKASLSEQHVASSQNLDFKARSATLFDTYTNSSSEGSSTPPQNPSSETPNSSDCGTKPSPSLTSLAPDSILSPHSLFMEAAGAESPNASDSSEAPCRKAEGKKTTLEKTTNILLWGWILLPAVMVGYDVYMGMTGQFPSLDDFWAAGYKKLGDATYTQSMFMWQELFNALGILTVITSFIYFFKNLKQRKNKKSQKTSTGIFSKIQKTTVQNLGYIIPAVLFVLVVASTIHEIFYMTNSGALYAVADGFNYLVYISIFVLAWNIPDFSMGKKLVKVFLYIILLMEPIVLLQQAGVPFIYTMFASWNSAIFQQFNYMGYMLCMTLLGFVGLYLYEKEKPAKKVWYLFCIALTTVTLIYNNTMGAILAATVSLPFIYGFYHMRKHSFKGEDFMPLVIYVFMFLMGLLGVFPDAQLFKESVAGLFGDIATLTGMDTSKDIGQIGTSRGQLWKDTLERIPNHPLLGHGPSGFTFENAITNMDSPHNEYLQVAGFLGLPCLAGYLTGLFSIVWKAFNKISEGSEVGIEKPNKNHINPSTVSGVLDGCEDHFVELNKMVGDHLEDVSENPNKIQEGCLEEDTKKNLENYLGEKPNKIQGNSLKEKSKENQEEVLKERTKKILGSYLGKNTNKNWRMMLEKDTNKIQEMLKSNTNNTPLGNDSLKNIRTSKNPLKNLQTPKNLNTNTPLENDSMVVSGMLLGYFISAFFGNMAYMTYVFPVLFLGLLYRNIKRQ